MKNEKLKISWQVFGFALLPGVYSLKPGI